MQESWPCSCRLLKNIKNTVGYIQIYILGRIQHNQRIMLKYLCHGTGSKLLHDFVYSYLIGHRNILSNYRSIRTAIQRGLLQVIQQ